MENKKNLRFFVIITNVAFWLMLGFCGLLMAIGLPMETISKYAPIVCSWASFLVLMLWAKKILPGTSRKAFIKDLFRDRVKWQTVLLTLGIPVAVFTVSAVVMSVVFKVPLGKFINTDFAAYPAMFLLKLLAGPMGEEPGWRGYYLIGSTKVRGVLRGTMMTGLFWGLWHFPLWLMEGYSPAMLIAYAASFLTAIISFNVTLSYIYLKYRNLLYCILMHQMFNFLTGLFNFGTDALPGDKAMVVFMVISTVCYALVAVITVLINKDKVKVSDELVSPKKRKQMVMIRRYREDDAGNVSDLIRKTIKISNAKDYPSDIIDLLDKTETPEHVSERAGWTHFYVVEECDQIIGCGAIGPYWGKEDESSLFTIFVDPDHQGKGIGRAIIETLENDEFFLRAKRIEIPASITGVPFYRKFGYDFKDGIKEPDAEHIIRLEKHRL